MKVKKFINQEINGFLIIDTYLKITPNGKKTRKVLLKCLDCGREFERHSGVDFEHIKCKCKCASYPKNHRKKYKWNNKEYLISELSRMSGVPEQTLSTRINQGYSVDEAMTNRVKKICLSCGKEFETTIAKRYCSQTCLNRSSKKRKYKPIEIKKCVICGKQFESFREDARTCSVKCRRERDCNIRNNRYKKLREQGLFEESVTLKNVFIKFEGKCQCCGKLLSFDVGVTENDYPSIDHIIPISKNGAHTWDNVQLLCRLCNCKKSNK